MIKKVIFNFVFYLIGLIILVYPVYIIYSRTTVISVSPIRFQWVVLPYLIIGSIYLDYKYKSKFTIWRILPCGIISALGYIITTNIIKNYFDVVHGTLPDPMTDLFVYYLYIILFAIVGIVAVLHQLVMLFIYIYNKKKTI